MVNVPHQDLDTAVEAMHSKCLVGFDRRTTVFNLEIKLRNMALQSGFSHHRMTLQPEQQEEPNEVEEMDKVS